MPEVNRREFLGRTVMMAGVSLFSSEAWAMEVAENLTILEAGKRLRAHETTSVALVHALLARIDRFNPKLQTFITVMRESALREAALLDIEAAEGKFRGPLHGIPLGVKDNVDTAGTRTTVGSMLFDDHIPRQDAFVIRQFRHAGAILGRVHAI